MSERITILLATYNGEKYLEEQLRSIFKQSYRNFHLVVRDDRSLDGTQKILNKFQRDYPDRMTLHFADQNLGAAVNFAELFSLASRGYLMFSDQDDVWMEHKIEATYRKMKETEIAFGAPMPLLVHTDLTVVNEQLELVAASFWRYAGLTPATGISLNRLLIQNIVTGCTAMLNPQLFDLVKRIPPCAIVHDWWIALVASSFGRIVTLKAPTIYYRQHAHNVCGARPAFSLASLKKQLIKILDWKKWQTLSSHDKARLQQAKGFLKEYDHLLSQQQKKTLHGFVELEKCCFVNNYLLILKYRFFKHGFYRKLNQLQGNW